MARVDYSELVEAIQNGDDVTANNLLQELIPRIVDYLVVTMNADRNEARECTQEVFTEVYDRIRKDKIREHKYIFRYITFSVKNEYIRYKKYQHRFTAPEEAYDQAEPAEQIRNLIDEERMRHLEDCMYELDKESRSLIQYMLKHPDKSSKEYAHHFNISSGNVRIRKSRILNILHHCYKRKAAK